jgi:hypothetical protein
MLSENVFGVEEVIFQNDIYLQKGSTFGVREAKKGKVCR